MLMTDWPMLTANIDMMANIVSGHCHPSSSKSMADILASNVGRKLRPSNWPMSRGLNWPILAGLSFCLQCFDALGWASERVSSLQKN